MSDVVDPQPIIEERLRTLAAEHEPRIAALERAVGSAAPPTRRVLKRELRETKRAYSAARRAVESLRSPGVAW